LLKTEPPHLFVQLLRLARPHQWIKSGFVFVGILFAQQWRDPQLLYCVVIAAIAFASVSSAIYVINDLADKESDRRHPQKCRRPIAAGTISIGPVMGLIVLTAFVGLGLGFWVSGIALFLLILYLGLNVAYSFWLKHVVLLDVFVLASGFVLRILMGTLGVGIPASKWLLFTGSSVALFLGFAKRRAELNALGDGSFEHRKVLEDYNSVVLDKAIVVCAAMVITAYSLYTMSPETIRAQNTENLIYTVPFVMYGVFRYLFLLHQRGAGEDPSLALVRDRHILATGFVWLSVTLWIMTSSA
jgi:4-hydroxybenzoate polyprenyltransferase